MAVKLKNHNPVDKKLFISHSSKIKALAELVSSVDPLNCRYVKGVRGISGMIL